MSSLHRDLHVLTHSVPNRRSSARRTARHAHAPTPALVLVDQHNAVFLALVDGARWATGDAARVQAMLAQARQVHHERVFELAVNVFLHVFNAVVLRRSEEHTSELTSLMRISYAVFCLTKKK